MRRVVGGSEPTGIIVSVPTASLSPAQQLTYDMATKGASAVSAENLTPIIDWYKTKEG